MKLPQLQEVPSSRSMVNIFAGYNHNPRISDGEWYDMLNLSTQRYPIAGIRRPRTLMTTFTDPDGLIAKDALAWIEDDKLYYNGVLRTSLTHQSKPRQLVGMGAYIIIFPDKVWFNTVDNSLGNMESSFSNSNTLTFTLCTYTGDEYDIEETGITPPSSPQNGDYWMDTSGDMDVLRVYSTSTGTWNAVPTTYVKISGNNIGQYFSLGDGITISGLDAGTSEVEGFASLNGSQIIQQIDTNYIVIIGLIQENGSITTQDAVTITRTVPDMDFVCESGNRLWGCKYGMVNGETVNMIFASKLGDFKNWAYYAGTAADSYYMNLGSDGVFTGAISYRGMPTFFKENCIHIVYGDRPSSYQLKTIDARGVQKGSHKSLVVVDEVLYYQSRIDICSFTGAPPNGISDALGTDRFCNGVAGRRGSLYYISTQDVETGEYYLFCFDTKKGTWCKETEMLRGYGDEQNVGIHDMCYIDTDLIWLDNNGRLISTTGIFADQLVIKKKEADDRGETFDPGFDVDEMEKEEPVSWMAETGNIGFYQIDQKYIGRLVFRFFLATEAHMDLWVQYDSDGVWHHEGSVEGHGLRSTVFPIIPKRCDHMKIRMTGYGDFALYSTSYVLEQGSDIV